MNALLETLVKLQEVELERARVAQACKALPAEVAQAQSALRKAQDAAAEASSGLSREDTLRNKLEREIAQHRQKAQRYRSQLDTVTTPAQAQAMEHEIAFAEGEIERLENEELESLERTDQLEGSLARYRAQVEEEAVALEKTEARVKARQQELEGEKSALLTRREQLRGGIDADLLERFDRLAAHRGTAIARAEHQQCSGCRMGIRPQIWNQVREGELLNCDSCGRMLYWDPRMQPAEAVPEAPRSTDMPAMPRPRRVS